MEGRAWNAQEAIDKGTAFLKAALGADWGADGASLEKSGTSYEYRVEKSYRVVSGG